MWNLKGAIVTAVVVAVASCGTPALANGACCLASGTCIDDVPEELCILFEGIYQGDETDCAEIDGCTGACCLVTGACSDATEFDCMAQNGDYQGNGTTCAFTSCPPPTGACCIPDGSCLELPEFECNAVGGDYMGAFTVCDDVDCAGACCLPDGAGIEGALNDCIDLGGSFQGFGTTLEDTYCGIGACVLPDGSCVDAVVFDCDEGDGLHLGEDSACDRVVAQVRPFAFELSPNDQTLVFDRFDDLDGTRLLVRTRLRLQGGISAVVTIENESETIFLEGLFCSMEGLLQILPPPAWLAFGFDEAFYSPPGTVLAPSDGIPGQGPDYFSFGAVGAEGADETILTAEPELAFFLGGPSTFPVLVVGSAGIDYTFPGIPITYTVDDFGAQGLVMITYEYQELGACCICEGTCIEGMDRDSCEAMPDARVWIPGGSCADGACACPADLDASGSVDVADLLALLAAWGSGGPAADFNCDAVVNTTDLLLLLDAWGGC